MKLNRRRLLTLGAQGLGLIAVGVVSVPSLIKSLTPVLKSQPQEDWRAVGAVMKFPIGSMKKAIIAASQEDDAPAKAVYVWRKTAEEFIVYSRSCTDLGCPVNWDPGSEWFYCPCHGGIFDKTGERRAGPPKRPLWRYANRIREGALEIDIRSVPPMV